MEAAFEWGRRALAAWVDGCRRYARTVVVASIAATAAVLWFVVTSISINTDTTSMLSAELPFRRNSQALSDAFPQFSNNILIVIDGANADLADDAAATLATRLREQPNVFGSVFDPQGEAFLRRNGFLYLSTDELTRLSNRLAEAQPFLGTLWRDPSLRGLFDMLGLAADEILTKKGATGFEIDVASNAIAAVIEAEAAGRFAQLSWRELMGGDTVKPEDRRRLILLKPVLDFGSLQPASRTISAIRALVRDLGLDEKAGVRVRLTGSVALAHEELRSVEGNMGVAAVASLVLVFVLLTIGYRSWRLALAASLTIVAGLVWTTGFAMAAVGSLNLISVAFAVLFIGLSDEFGMHYGLRYVEAVGEGRGSDALREAADGSGGALVLVAVAAATGFLSFVPTDYLGLAQLGIIAAGGMVIALFANLTVLPALIALWPPRGQPRRPDQSKPVAILNQARAHPRTTAGIAVVVALLAASLIPKAHFDFDPLNLRDPETESVSTLFDLIADSRTTPYTIQILAPTLAEADALADKLDRLPEVDGTATLTDFVPKDQDAKLELIRDMGFFLAPAFLAERIAPPTPAARRAALDAVLVKLEALATARPTEHIGIAAARLVRGLRALAAAPDQRLLAVETRLLALLQNRLVELRESLNAEPVMLAALPASIRESQVSTDGRARLQVMPTDNIHDRANLVRFVTAVRTLAPDASGSPVVILAAGTTVVSAFRTAAIIAVVAIILLLIVTLRRLVDVAVVLAPLGLAALLTVATSVLFDIPFNFANVIALPLMFGLGVANGIHLSLRQREEPSVARVLETTTPRAVVFAAITTIASFICLAASSHPGTASMGILLAIAISFTLACTLLVQPALMELAARWAGPRRAASHRGS